LWASCTFYALLAVGRISPRGRESERPTSFATGEPSPILAWARRVMPQLARVHRRADLGGT
jgi:hypothetical protein